MDTSGDIQTPARRRLGTSLVLAGITTIAVTGLGLDACLRGVLLVVDDPSRRC